MDNLEQLWRAHLAAAFPRELTGEFIGTYDAVMLDADIAGCVSTFLQSQYKLDEERILVLRRCNQVLVDFINTLDGYPRNHYDRLKIMAEIVLSEVNPLVAI